MFKEESSAKHPANRSQVDALVLGRASEPVALAALASTQFMADQPGSSLEWNAATGSPAWIQGRLSKSKRGTANEISRSFLLDNPAVLGVTAEDVEELKEIDSFDWGGLQFIRHQQCHQGLPVIGASVLVAVDTNKQVKLVTSGLQANLSVQSEEKMISPKEARQIARNDLGEDLELRGAITQRIVLFPTPEGHVEAHQVTIPADNPLGSWNYFISTASGEILDSFNDMKFHSYFFAPRARVYPENPEETPLTTVMLRNINSPYKKLTGLYCKVINEDAPPAEAGRDYRFAFEPDNTHFDECQVYYAVEKAYQYFNELGFRGFKVNNPYGKVNGGQIVANVHVGSKFDNAYYDPSTGQIYFGDGSYPSSPDGLRDLAKEVDVVVHEFTHAVIDEYHPQMFGSEGLALHEGYADYFACSLFGDPDMGEYVVPTSEKDGMIRNCDNDIRYSETSTEPHDRGRAWAGACWHLRKAVGKEVADFMIFGSMLVLSSATPTFKYAKDMLLAIDQNWCGSEYRSIIKRIFEVERGIPA